MAIRLVGKNKPNTVRIACRAADTIELDNLIELQGNLKELSDHAYTALRKSIIELGFSFPVNAWQSGKKVFILDATQRTRVLRRMRDVEGWKVPPLPVAWVEAENTKEAATKLLAAAAQFGEVTQDGLYEFLHKFKLDFSMLKDQLKFANIDPIKFE